MLYFSKANAKLQKLALVPSLQNYLKHNRKVYSLDLLSGWSCPYANECLSKTIVKPNGSRHIQDGVNTKFRCFSATQETIFPALHKIRESNFKYLRKLISTVWPNSMPALFGTVDAIHNQLPKDLGILRLHVGGDFFNELYFDTINHVAYRNPDILFYAYTKSLKFWVQHLHNIAPNFVLTASYGGREDHLISQHNLRHSVVIAEPDICKEIIKQKSYNVVPNLGTKYDGLPIDHDDSHAANPNKKNQNFALLIHGIQPKNSEASRAKSILKGIGSYVRK